MKFFSQKFRKLTGQKKLSFEITHTPGEINTELIRPGEIQCFQEVSDIKIVKDVRYPIYVLLFIGFIGLICISSLISLPYMPYENINSEQPETWAIYVFVVVVILVALLGALLVLFSIKNIFTNKARLIIFNRESGIVTLPGRYWGKPETIPFKDVYAIISMHPTPIPNYDLSIIRSDGQPVNINIGIVVTKEQALGDWSFWVMYMDKNKPLPASPVFDKYR